MPQVMRDSSRVRIVYGEKDHENHSDLSVKTIKHVQKYMKRMGVVTKGPKSKVDNRFSFIVVDARGPNEKVDYIKSTFVYTDPSVAEQAGKDLLAKIKNLPIA